MKNDKEWLKEKVQTMIDEECRCYDPLIQQRKHTCRVIMDLIEQLDEPEKLSEEWINEHSKSYTMENAVEISDLKNLLLPQPEKPVIPQFVADYYNDYKNYELTFEEWFECSEFGKGGKTENKTFEWLLDNSHEVNIERQFILADIIAHGLDGYEVEKEKLYHVVNKENYFMLRKYDGLVDIMQVSSTMSRDEFGKDTRFMLTEQEIKDYDERYWAFAEEVTE